MRATLAILFLYFLSSGSFAQIQNVNISGSYSGVFMLSGTASDYKVNGSPYLSEDWMYGTLEMKSEIAAEMNSTAKEKARIDTYAKKISRIDELIGQIHDSGFQTTGLSLTMSEVNQLDDNQSFDVNITNEEFSELPGITEELKKDLISFLTRLRSEYAAGINTIHEIKGLFRYNLYGQEFEMIHNKDTFAIIAPFNIQSITISNKKFVHGFYVKRKLVNEYLGSAYFEVLNEGSCRLLMRHDVKIKSGGGPATHSWAGSDADAFVQYKQLYFQNARGSEVVQFRKRKKYLRRVFADQYDLMEKYIRSEKIKVKNVGELIKVFNYYNSLNS